MRIKLYTLTFAVALLVVFLGACGGSQTESTEPAAQQTADAELPPGHPPMDQPAPSASLPAPVMSAGSALAWTKPADWVEEPPANPMRQAQFRVPGPAGDGLCVVYYFGAGQGGGPQANAERWADQFEQEDGSSSRDVLVTEAMQVNDMPLLLVEVKGTYNEGGMMMTGGPQKSFPGYMLKGAIIEGPDANWFFKFTGPEATVKAHSEQFTELLESIQGPA